MDITWYGRACFRIREMGVTIIMDPHGKESGYSMPRIRADVVVLSHAYDEDNRPKGIRGSPRILQTPGEYEIGGVFVTGISTLHSRRAQRQNIVFLCDFDGLTVCHLGSLGHIPSQSQVEPLNGVNILLIPIGGRSTITIDQTAEMVNLLEPNIVIPMHYNKTKLSHNPSSISRVLKAMGVDEVPLQETLKIRSGHLPNDTQIVLLGHKQ